MKFRDWDEKKTNEAMGFVQKLPYQLKKKEKSTVGKVNTSNITRKVDEPKDIKKAIIAYVKGVQEIYNKNDSYNKEVTPPKIEFKKGGRYYKIITKQTFGSVTSVHSFVDAKVGPEFGNVYKAASWKAPAKGARGNVFSPTNGLEAISKSGGNVWYAKSGRR